MAEGHMHDEQTTAMAASQPENKDAAIAKEGEAEHGPTEPKDSSRTLSQIPQLSSATPVTSNAASTVSSARTSREGSPVRSAQRSGSMATAWKDNRSRKNSLDLSPSRASSTHNIPTIPSTAAIQRALSAAGVPQSQTPGGTDPSVESPRPLKQGRLQSGNNTPLPSTVPRFKSPPPPSSKSNIATSITPRSAEPPLQTPSVTVERATPIVNANVEPSSSAEDSQLHTVVRTSARGANNTIPSSDAVQEANPSAKHSTGTGRGQQNRRSVEDERPERIEEDPLEEALAEGSKSVLGSGSDSGGNKSSEPKDSGKGRQPSAMSTISARPLTLQPKLSSTQLRPPKGKPSTEGSTKTMTVETETVSTIPQVAVGGGAGERGAPSRVDTGGSVRLKRSSETIRPKKEKKRNVRKAPSIHSGTASSKADIFEAKIATAVDEANSSDSEETFVYESNPPEPLSARPRRFHSRTPSTTSMASQTDYGNRTRQDGYPSLTGKKSMKFANNIYHVTGHQGDKNDSVRGTGISPRIGGGSGAYHHAGHPGRITPGHHTSLFDNDSPFPNAARQMKSTAGNVARLPSRPSSPRNSHILRMPGGSKKLQEIQSYDLEGEGADDERTPLIGYAKSGRNRNSRRPTNGSNRHLGYVDSRDRNICRRILIGVSATGLVVSFIAAIVMGLVLCSKPLIDVYIKDIQNVLASEQEIMLDLHVHATNPNLIAIQVSDLDINIFAKSKYVGTNALWRIGHLPPKAGQRQVESSREDLGLRSSKDKYHTADDDLTDPIEDPASDSQTMLLGQIFEFDSPLIFEPSPIRYRSHSSAGEVRLAKPGNRTEEGGSERWERVLQHPFELIVRGVIRYSLPVSSKPRSAKIASTVIVHPEAEVDKRGRMQLEPSSHIYFPGSNTLIKPHPPPMSKFRFTTWWSY